MKKHYMTGLLLVLVCLWGGYYEFASAIYCILFLIGLWLIYREEKRIKLPCNVTTYCVLIIFLCYILTVIGARDKGIAVLGILKIAVPVLFWMLWNNLPLQRREELFSAVPRVGAIVTAIALAGYFHPYLKHYLYRANRLGGIFQYSNTYAMFLLTGLLILFYKRSWTTEEKIEQMILIIGIIFTGSRGVFLLMIAALLLIFFRKKTGKKETWTMAGIMVLLTAAILITAQTFLKLDIGRLSEITLESQSLNMRLLYYKDGIGMIMKHPLGLGYMGYYFLQPQFQTGYYVTKFVHNDLLQCALDAGWIAMTALAVMIFVGLFSKKNTEVKRILLLFLFLHGLFDFDQQFSVMYCVLLMCMTEPETKGKWMEISRSWSKSAMLMLGCIALYFAVALGAAYKKQYTLALQLYPGNTLAAIPQVKAGDRDEAARVIAQNGMTVSAYDIAAQAALEGQNYKTVLDNVRGMLQCAGYNLYYYNHAVYYLRDAMEMAKLAKDKEIAEEILREIENVSERLEMLREKTSVLAYRTAYPPEFELDEDVRIYLYLLTEQEEW